MKNMPMQLNSKNYFDDAVEMQYAYYKSAERLCSTLHVQDFFCLFLVVEGSVLHRVNEQQKTLVKGELCFIRPGDVHAYHAIPNIKAEAINIVISARTVDDLFNYLGDGFNSTVLLTSTLPPVVLLAEPIKKRIQQRLQQLNLLPKNQPKAIRSTLRVILFELIAEYFSPLEEKFDSKVPEWLQQLSRKMQKLENFSLGLPQMKSLSGVSNEHLCRSFKKHFNISPTTYINDLRLAYVVNLLLHTDMPITDIALEAGFDSLSYFNNLFKKKLNCTPSEHRNSHRKKW